ncbi:UxaA family hydrolase [uncultured Veillonella sp.]|uniref:UxaA family hydrolase n=1 Tax=uncultured Veillonella sp. TaxID=159268 RepID=UPI0025EEE03C|nr:UxaA family hydrolase [uncultured Veillonella sp.]MDY3974194.1 UxaA family hydrolase [Veillonella caviae]
MREVIKVNPNDNVAIAVVETGLPKDHVVEEINVTTLTEVPFGHKVALETIKKDAPVIRYGVAIGYAKEDLPAGTWVNETNIYVKPSDEMNTSVAHKKLDYRFADAPKPETRYFMGYRNSDGTAGTRNLLTINTTVQCVEGVVNYAVDKIRQELLPNYPNVDGVVAVNHIYGCGVAIDGKGSEIPQRTIRHISENPNMIEGRMVVGLGCEKFNPERAYPDYPIENVIMLQDCQGFAAMVETILAQAKNILEKLNQRKREPIPVSELSVGMQCGGSDAFSGLTANPSMGYASDLLVLHGAKVIFSEMSEVRDAVHIMKDRMLNDEVVKQLDAEVAWYDEYLAQGKVDRTANTSLGNKAGGLSTIVEKSMGSVAKSGTSEIVDVISVGEKIRKPGLTFAATPASDFVCGTEQLASGITLQLFSSGRGTTYNLPYIPVLKVSTNPVLSAKWHDIIDVDCGRVLTGEESIETMGEAIFELIIKIASGEVKTKSDTYGIYNALAVFNPAPIT